MEETINDELKKEIYKDAVQPASKSFGEAVKPAGEVLGKAVVSVVKTADALLISPFHLTVWGVEALKEHFIPKVDEKLKTIPEEKRTAPDPLIAGPVLQAVRFASRHKELQDLFANLLVTAIDSDTLQNAHPAFVDIINQLSPDEAKILHYAAGQDLIPLVDVNLSAPGEEGSISWLRNISKLPFNAGCSHLKMGPSYIDNLCRLQIFDKPAFGHISATDAYSNILDEPFMSLIAQTEKQHLRKARIEKGYVRITDFGRQFINSCVLSKS